MPHSIKKLAEQIVAAAKDNGFIVQRYDAYSTQSVYLKLDYGVCNSIRISNHTGKKHLSYRFNLLTDIKQSYTVYGEYPRKFYTTDDIQKMIDDIINHRETKIEKYGQAAYDRLMKKNRQENEGSRGFWKQAKLV
jgi:Glu-tRNA(Gln) amidotransferase subunit E-like FAD-binding protein